MNAFDYILIGCIAAAVLLAARGILKNRKKGCGCGCSCSDCNHCK